MLGTEEAYLFDARLRYVTMKQMLDGLIGRHLARVLRRVRGIRHGSHGCEPRFADVTVWL